MALLVECVTVIRPVQFVVEVNTQKFVFLHHLYVQSLDVHRYKVGCFPPEVDDHLLRLAGIEVKLVELAPADKVPDDRPVFQVIFLRNTSNNGCVIGSVSDTTILGW